MTRVHSGLLAGLAFACWLPALAILSLPALALAADPAAQAAFQAAFGQLVEYLISGLVAVGGAVALWGLHWLERKLGLERNAQARQVFETAALNGLAYARELALQAGKDIRAPAVRNELVATALTYVLPKVPETARRLRLTPECIAERLIARLDAVAPIDPPPGPAAS